METRQKKLVHELRMAKAVTTTDGEPLLWKEPLQAGTMIKFTFPIPTSSYKPTPVCAIDIVYEDDHCLVVSKPKGMSTHPNDARDTHTCMNHVMAHIKEQGGMYAEHVHRLDQGTQGLLLVAKHPLAKSIFDRMIEEKKQSFVRMPLKSKVIFVRRQELLQNLSVKIAIMQRDVSCQIQDSMRSHTMKL